MLYEYRPAIPADTPFLAAALWYAEAGPSSASTYERLFGLSAEETLAVLAEALEEDLPGSELARSSYWVAVAAGQPVATCAAWLEGAGNQASGFLKAQILPFVLGAERWRAAAGHLRAFAAVNLPRTPGTVQLEAFYTAPQHRGNGLARRLISAQLARFPAAHRAEIQLTTANPAAQRAYEKAGFVADLRKDSAAAEVARLLGAPGKVRLAKTWA